MVGRTGLLAGLREQVATLEADLRAQATLDEGREQQARAWWTVARSSLRTEAPYGAWLDEQVTQAAVAWVLGTVFLRFSEDNGLLPQPFIAGPGKRLIRAQERQASFFKGNPWASERDWILQGFAELSRPTLAADLLGSQNPIHSFTPSREAAANLIDFWRRSGDGQDVAYDFTDPSWDTSFLEDLYHGLSEPSRKTYALLQTPTFITEFILDHTLNSAIDEFGLDGLRFIDPVCGSGTFVLGAFHRLLEHWRQREPDGDPWELISNVLSSVHGVDKNPYAVAITRFRLIVAAVRASGQYRLVDAPDVRPIIATGDSLLRGRDAPGDQSLRLEARGQGHVPGEDIDAFALGDVDLLGSGSYHVVVGNPPYLAVKDRAEDRAYRAAYPVCVGSYALTIPFIVRFFDLAIRQSEHAAGFVGLLSSNSFMKREFGRKLIEEFLPAFDLTHLVDTSGAYIPGHGTPTVILLGRGRRPKPGDCVRAIVGLRGEPEIPDNPAQGRVWQSILTRFGRTASYEDDWTQEAYFERASLSSFPWNLSDDSTRAILRRMERGERLGSGVARIGYFANTGSDDLFTAPAASFRRIRAEADSLIPVITGSAVRDWTATAEAEGFFIPGAGKEGWRPIEDFPHQLKRLWPYRTTLGNRPNYSRRSFFQDQRAWYEWHHVTESPHAHPWSIVFSWVSTHNHFAVLREHAAPLHSAPVIRLPKTASDTDVLQLTALLNSSTVCFWLKQYSNSKGQPRADQTGSGEPWTEFYEFTGGRLTDLPLPPGRWSGDRWSVYAERLDRLAQEVVSAAPKSLLAGPEALSAIDFGSAESRWEALRGRLVALQEELDWEVYGRYGLLDQPDEVLASADMIPEIRVGERAFEIVLARRIARRLTNSTWFERHHAIPSVEVPAHWPGAYKQVVEKRIELIEKQQTIALIEQPKYKRRWADVGWHQHLHSALREWLLDRCETAELWYSEEDGKPRPLTISALADRLVLDEDFVSAAATYAPGKDLTEMLHELLAGEHVPYLAAMRFKASGIRKRSAWEEVWRLQRMEDELRRRNQGSHADSIRDTIPTPPNYSSADFLRPSFWRNRGKHDIPNERFVSYPDATDNRRLLIGWAGWSPVERAYALIPLIEGLPVTGRLERAIPLLAGLQELLPWIRQWHVDMPPAHAETPADLFEVFLASKLAAYGLSPDDLKAWRPPQPKRGRPRKHP
ncbi:BREX-2 system adenine-specific DNA-methyltransferase PglX [Actinoallomurus vinaceus]|uniref:site-specific DNA-methyltransferase (adenine-specific) n=1 Tax=Actinoallomurus vinaceus TaxID=1080074 RepID=A0ABP8UG62_9ACTN